MAGVSDKFLVASLFMWVAPIAILYAFNNNLSPGSIFSAIGSIDISPYTVTLLIGLLVVVSVNVAIAISMFKAMKESSGEHHLDPGFLEEEDEAEDESNEMQENSSATYQKEE